MPLRWCHQTLLSKWTREALRTPRTNKAVTPLHLQPHLPLWLEGKMMFPHQGRAPGEDPHTNCVVGHTLLNGLRLEGVLRPLYGETLPHP